MDADTPVDSSALGNSSVTQIFESIRAEQRLVVAYSLFAISFVLPALGDEVGFSSPIHPGWQVFVWGPVLAYMMVIEPGAAQHFVLLGVYYLVAWTANFAFLVPPLRMLPFKLRLRVGILFTAFAWSILLCFLLIPESMISAVSIGYYCWAVGVTLIFLNLRMQSK